MKQVSLFILLCIGIGLSAPKPCKAQRPGRADSNLSSAYQLSWNQQFAAAVQAFDQYLIAHPEDPEAKMGKAWTLAWAGKYPEASRLFRQILKENPANFEAQKGLAYLALWQQNYLLAMQLFDRLIIEQPEAADLQMAAGLARVHSHYLKGARIHQARLEKLDPNQANALLGAIQATPGFLEIEAWGGSSVIDDQRKSGLRALRLSLTPQPEWSAWIRYDNSLSLDGFSASQINQPIPGIFAGGILHPSNRSSTRIEIGLRDLPEEQQSWVVMGEQSYWLKDNLVVKAGGLYDFRDKSAAEHLIYGGFAGRIGKALWIEPLYFRNFIWIRSARQDRISLSGKYNWQLGNELQIGLLYGWQLQESKGGSDPISGGWIRYQHPVMNKHTLFVMARREYTPVANLTILALGFRYKIEQ